MREEIEKMKKEIKELTEQIELLKDENKSQEYLMWLLIQSQGGKIIVANELRQDMPFPEKCYIEKYNNIDKRQTEYRSFRGW